MPRGVRHKSSEATFYHLMDRVAGSPRFFPFHNSAAKRRFIQMLRFYLSIYFCKLVSHQIMGNHYHLIVYFEQFRSLPHEQLVGIARRLWGDEKWKVRTRGWEQQEWDVFNRRLFDLSSFMQRLNGEYAKWYNRHFQRRGHFWAQRYKNPELLDLRALQDCLIYVELNAVRAGLVRRPEQWKGGSARWRWAGKHSDVLMPLQEIFPEVRPDKCFRTYRSLLYYRGGIRDREGQGMIPAAIVRQEQKRGFEHPGVYRQRIRAFTDGVALGPADRVRELLDCFRRQGIYHRRRHPVSQLQGSFYTCREQRSHAVSFG